jgi:hypothetical protein
LFDFYPLSNISINQCKNILYLFDGLRNLAINKVGALFSQENEIGFLTVLVLKALIKIEQLVDILDELKTDGAGLEDCLML